jgi:hypothetical protein
LSDRLSLIAFTLVAGTLTRDVEPIAEACEDVPVGVFVSLLEGIIPRGLCLIVLVAAEDYGEGELRQVAIG